MVDKIIDNIKEYNKYEDIVNELLNLKRELKKNNIKYEKVIDIIIKNDKVSRMLELLINRYHDNDICDNFILDLKVIYRDLNKEDDPEIIELMTNKNKDNKERIIIKYDRLVYKFALKKANQGIDIEDLVQEGRLGLLKAYEVYDINRCTKFMTVAVCWIKRYIQIALANNKRLIRLPMYLDYELSRIRSFKNKYLSLHGKEATIEEIAKELNMDISKIESLLIADSPIFSLDLEVESPTSSDPSLFLDIIPDYNPGPEEISERKMLRDDFNTSFKQANLTEKEIYVLNSRYGINDSDYKTLETVAHTLNVTRQGAKYIQEKAIKKLTNYPGKLLIESYVKDNIVYTSSLEHNVVLNHTKENKKSFYGLFKGYNTENLESIVKELPKRYQELIYKKYGENLDSNLCSWDKNESFIYYNNVRKLILEKLVIDDNIINPKTLLGRLKIKDIKMVEHCIEGLYPEYKELIYKKYGVNLTEYYKLSKVEERIITTKIIPLITIRYNKLLEGKEIKEMKRNKKKNTMVIQPVSNEYVIEDFKYLENIVSTEEFKNYLINSKLDMKTISVVSLLFGYYNDKYYKIDYISKFLSIPREDILSAVELIIREYNNKVKGSNIKQLKKILH